MKATIICIGDEVLSGDTLNSNATFLAGELTEIGVEVVKHVVVSDDEAFVEGAFKDAFKISNLIVTTGGLGPTEDDMTKAAIAKITGCELKKSEEAYAHIEEYFKNSKYKMTPNNFSQAYFPEGSRILPNDVGTAPGALLEKDGKIIVMFPGPPRELKRMFTNYVKDFLMKKLNKFFAIKMYMTTGAGESMLEHKMREVLPNIEGVSVNTYFGQSGVRIKALSKADDIQRAEENLDKMDKSIMKYFNEYIYSTNGESMQKALMNELEKESLTFACAESCTGGLVSAFMTEEAGVSKYYKGGITSYSNEIKMKELGVSKETLDKYGAVSSQCVEEMVRGVAQKFGAEVAVSTSGIAGPDGGSEEKPVGTVYLGYYYKGKVASEKIFVTGERKRIQSRSAYTAINNIRKYIIENR